MKWLGLFPGAYGDKGGLAQFNRHLLDALATDRRLTLRALGFAGDPRAPAPAEANWSIPSPGSRLGFALHAAKAAARARPDVVVAGHAHFGAISWPIATARRARLMTLTHGVEVWEPGRGIDALALRRSAMVTTVSRYTRERLLAWCDIAPERVVVLHNTIELDRYVPGGRPRDLEERLGVTGKKVLLTVGRLSPHERYKGHDRVLPLLPELERRAGPLHYLIVGSGDDRARLETLAHASGAGHLVTFVGYVPDELLPEYYRLADAFVMPSTGEGFGIVFLEAMACGCPVVAGDRDGSRDALCDGDLGRIVEPDSPPALRDAIVATLREGRSHETRIPGVERFDVEHFRARVRELVSSLG